MAIAQTAFELLLSCVLCGLIGLEREWRHKAAGFRTHVLVGLGTTCLTHLSLHGFLGSDPARLASQVVTGVGFIGAGAILQRGHFVRGVTTAATLWATMSVGMAIGAGWYQLAGLMTALVLLVLVYFERIARSLPERHVARRFRMRVSLPRVRRSEVMTLLERRGGIVRREGWRRDPKGESIGLSVVFIDGTESDFVGLAHDLLELGAGDVEWFTPDEEEES
jgi:putative Mg2+ transporter-C (MgtC) family protein